MGLFDGLDLSRRMQNPLVQMGAQMLANSGPSLQPKGLFEGAPEAIARGLKMQQDQKKLDQDEEAKNQTLELLRTEDPDLAAMIEAGNIDARSAIQLLMDKRQQQQGWAREDARDQRNRAWQVEDRDFAANRPDWVSYEASNGDILRGNRNDPNSEMSVWFDGPDPAPKAPNIESFFDEETGREFKGYLDPSTGNVVRVGGSGVKAPSGPQVVNNIGNGSKFLEESDKAAAGRLNDVVVAGQNASQFMGDVNALAALGAQVGTGKGAEVKAALGPYAQALGFEIDGLSEIQAYQAIVDRMAPAMRPAGSGASSDFDARQFLNSLPALWRTPEGNKIATETLTALQQHKIAAAEIASRAYLSPEDPDALTWQQAEAEIRKLPDPYNGFNEYRKRAGSSGDEGRKTSTGVNWNFN